MVWDTTASHTYTKEAAYFSALEFAIPTSHSSIYTVPLNHLFAWLLKPQGLELIEGEETNVNSQVPCHAFALLAEPRALHTSDGKAVENPHIGIGVAFIPLYMKKVSFTQAYFLLSQWQQGREEGIQEEWIMFLHISIMSNMSLHLQPYPLWFDYVERRLMEDSLESFPLHCFRGFRLQQVAIMPPDYPSGVVAPYIDISL